MLNKKVIIFELFIFTLILSSCQKDIIKKTDAKTVFEVFWQTMDERYVFFNEKNLNWDSIYDTYYPKIDENTTEEELITYFKEIINYIKDGHVYIQLSPNRIIFYRYAGFYSFPEPFVENPYSYSDTTVVMEPIEISQYRNNILYLKIYNFFKPIDIDKFKQLITNSFKYKNGIIIDLRGNGGGLTVAYQKILALFIKGQKTVLYKKQKTGKEHNAFSDYIPIQIEGVNFFDSNIPVVVLTDKGTFSSGSVFSAAAKSFNNFYRMGECTGGGGGSPTYIKLPNNWILSYTYRKYYDIDKNNFEEGVMPDTIVEMTDYYRAVYELSGKDVVIHNAIRYLGYEVQY